MVSYKALNTTIEAVISQTSDGVGNGDGVQTFATSEAVISQTSDGVGNGDGVQTFAISEAVISQPRDGVGNVDGGQTAATREAVISQTRDGVRNGDGGQSAATFEAVISQTRYRICESFKRHCFGNHHIACVFIIIRVPSVPLKGHSSRFISFVQIVENPIYLCVVSPRRKDSP